MSRTALSGFSLIELMVAVAVLGILLAIGVPSMERFLTSRAVLAQAEGLASALRQARSEALKLNAQVTVCSSSDTTASTPSCSNAPSWLTGWITFIDLDGDGALSSGERLLRVQSPVTSIKEIDADGTGFVRFHANGLSAIGAASFEVQPKLSSSDAGYEAMLRRVCVYPVGRAVIKPGSDSC